MTKHTNPKWSMGYYPLLSSSVTLPSESEGWQAGQPHQSCRAPLVAPWCSVKWQRRQDGPLTTDSCQGGDILTPGRPVSSSGGDKCLAGQLAYEITGLPSAAHSSTGSDSLCGLQLSCSPGAPVCARLRLTPSRDTSTARGSGPRGTCGNRDQTKEDYWEARTGKEIPVAQRSKSKQC